MNIKVARTMLILCIIYIVGFYVLKFAFPEKLLLVVTDQNIINIGTYVAQHLWALHLMQFVSTFVTFFLFVCATQASFRLKWINLIYMLIACVIDFAVVEFLPEMSIHTSTSLMLMLALLCNGKLIYTTISFVLHGYLSQFLFSIRGFETVIMYINPISALVLALEGLVWLIILALVFYLMEKKKHGTLVTTISK